MTPASSFLDALKLAAEHAERAENDFRREIAERTKALERERAFAHRRLSLMRAVGEAVASAETEEAAIAASTSVVCTKLGWESDSEAREEVTSRFAAIAQALFASLAPQESEDSPRPDVIKALSEFETWYAETHPSAFWVLFEHYMPETPRVDF